MLSSSACARRGLVFSSLMTATAKRRVFRPRSRLTAADVPVKQFNRAKWLRLFLIYVAWGHDSSANSRKKPHSVLAGATISLEVTGV
jgi:hypothetical protein